jgi:2'-5' RNA ligase
MARLFVAIYPPRSVVAALAALPRAVEPNVRWVPIDQLHVTLRFFGEVDVEPTKDRLGEVIAGLASASVTMGPCVSRLGREVVCVPVAGLDGLASAVVEATAHLGARPDPRPFRGHLTLARLRRRAACGLTGTPFSATFVADRIHLVESVTGRGGAHHSTIASWWLSIDPSGPATDG